MSQLDDFVATPMGPGLKGDNPPGQSVHPQGVGARDLGRQRDPSRPAADQPEHDDLTEPRTRNVDSAG